MTSIHRPSSSFLLGAALALALAWASLRAAQNPPASVPQSMIVRVEADTVTAEIFSTPAQTVLAELAAWTGVVFEVAAQWNPPISVVFYRSGVKEAIERCLATSDSIFYFGRDALGRSRVEVVRVFPRGMKGQPAALRILGTGAPTKTGDDSVETVDQAVRALAESGKVDVRLKAIDVLAAAKGPAAGTALSLALDDKAAEVRVAAMEALAGLGERTALPRILAALRDPHAGVRQGAVEALALLGTAQNIKELRSMARETDPGVAAAVELAIRRLSERR